MRWSNRIVRAGALVPIVLAVGAGCASNDASTSAGGATTTSTAKPAGTSAPTSTAAATGTTAAPATPGAVRIVDYEFVPGDQTVKVGERVTWTNEDEFAHYVKSDSGIDLDSGSMKQGGTYSHAFDKPGTYAYHCQIHNVMKGTITVT